jgi:alkylhydroperoxidase/carboxymuconolactone decarboxylase family protein YurZ
MNARITISVPEQVVVKAQRAVDSGYADSVSGYFTDLAEREPDWVEARAAIDELISDSGGLSDEDRQWATSVLDGPAAS